MTFSDILIIISPNSEKEEVEQNAIFSNNLLYSDKKGISMIKPNIVLSDIKMFQCEDLSLTLNMTPPQKNRTTHDNIFVIPTLKRWGQAALYGPLASQPC